MGIGKSNGKTALSGGIGKDRKELLYRLVLLVKALYPNQRSTCPYRLHTAYLDKEEQLLFADLVHSLTLLNQSSHASGHLISTQTEMLNALQMTLPEQYQLTPRLIDNYQQLREIFGEKHFTYHQAASRLKLSSSTVKRRVICMELHQLIEKHYDKRGKAWLQMQYRITTENPLADTFEIMQGEWKDYKGFVAL